MKKKTVLFLVLVLLFLMLLTNGLQGEEEQEEIRSYIEGNEYLKMDEVHKNFYVLGLIDMLYNQTFFYDKELYSDINEVAGEMESTQIKAIFDKYLEEHPEYWHLIASSIFWTAINELVSNR